MPLYNAGI
uniref:Uncharacterized protein n=1 Tax=Anguilla anguilla TaxID=7936 RepID=A0A0E9USE2_ANGAN